MKLRARFTLILLAIVVLLSCGFLGFLYLAERRHLLKESEKLRREAVHGLARVSQEAFLSKDEIMLLNYVKDLTRSQDVLWAMFMDLGGKVWVHSDLSMKNRVLQDPASKAALSGDSVSHRSYAAPDGGQILEYAAPVRFGRNNVGVARLGYDALKIRNRITKTLQNAFRRFSGVTLLGLLVGIVLAVYVANTLTWPIQVLTEGARQIGQGHLSTRIPSLRKDEIGQLSREFNAMAQRLGELDKVKDGFISSVSHDLRGPLASILSSCKYLLEIGDLKEKDQRILKITLRSADKLMEMVNNVLDIATMKSGRLEYKKGVFLPQKIIREVLALYKIPAAEKGIALKLSLAKNLPLIEVDEAMTHRIFNNILSNAVKFTRQGGRITMGAQLETGGGHVKFSVADNGYGIPEKELPKVFDRFTSVSQIYHSAQKQRGAGLGLSIAKAIVEDHGGRIWVESKVDRGTTFHWTLPVFHGSMPKRTETV